MFILLQIIAALLACLVAGVFASDTFAYEVSRVVEALFDFVEYRLVLWDERHAKASGATLCSANETLDATQVGSRLVTRELTA